MLNANQAIFVSKDDMLKIDRILSEFRALLHCPESQLMVWRDQISETNTSDIIDKLKSKIQDVLRD